MVKMGLLVLLQYCSALAENGADRSTIPMVVRLAEAIKGQIATSRKHGIATATH
jgi:hypothetical protein